MSVAVPRVQLKYEELLQIKWIMGAVLMLLSLWTLFPLELGASWLLAPVAVITAAVLLFPGWPACIPGWAWKLAAPAIILFTATDFLLSRPDIIGPLVRMIVLLAMLRTLSYRGRREDLQLVLLCLFMVVMAGVLSLSLNFALQVILFAPAAMLLLFLVDLTGYTNREDRVKPEIWRQFAWSRLIRRVLAVCNRHLVAFAALLFALLLSLSSLLFIMMPRFQLDQALPFLSMQSNRSVAGFSDNISFGDVVDILEDNRVAFRVDVDATDGVPAVPYWRMVVLDEYHGSGFRLSRSARSDMIGLSTAYYTPPMRAPPSPDTTRWTFYYEGGISTYLPRVGRFTGLRFQNRQDQSQHTTLFLSATREISSSVLFYQVDDMAADTEWPGGARDRELAGAGAIYRKELEGGDSLSYPATTLVVPAADRETIESYTAGIYEELGRSPEDVAPRAFADAAVRWLQSRHGYALQTRVPSGDGDLLVRWMRSQRDGHCELFAGAFTLLARSAGIPARVVTGFVGGTWNGYENYFMVRNRDAHAWVEAYDSETHSWFRVDPTPGSDSREQSDSDGEVVAFLVDRTFSAYLDSLRILWYRRVVNFDQEQQEQIVGAFQAWGSALADDLRARGEAIRDRISAWFSTPWDGRRWLELLRNALVAVASWLVLRLGLVMLYRRLRRRRGHVAEITRHPIRRRAGKYLRKLAAQSAPAYAPEEAVRADLLCLRYGPGESWPEPTPVFRRARTLLRGRS